METESDKIIKSQRYVVSAAIEYPNGRPHIGHALEKVAADVVARYHRLLGHDTYFSMGLDENSFHVLAAAHGQNIEPAIWLEQMNREYQLVWSKLDISYDDWIRTTEDRHVCAAQEFFRRVQANGDIYRTSYAGWYCPNCNNYYTAEELFAGHCPDHPSIAPEWLHEENYFFALSRYSDALREHMQGNPDFITPASRKAEVMAFLQQGLHDFSISRQVRPGREGWGIGVPGDPEQVMYVWFDALINYLTTVGFPDDTQRLATYWPADTHVIGKDITRLHCIYWPAMLLAAGLPLPRQIAVHGFVMIEGQRISKTQGNSVDPVRLVDALGADPIRFALLRYMSFASDSDFSRAGLLRAYNEELGNDLGNLLNRVVSMLHRYRQDVVPSDWQEAEAEEELRLFSEETGRRVASALENWEIGVALGIIWKLVRRVNQYLERNQPWQLARQPEQVARLDTVLAVAAEATRLLSIFLAPFIPASCDRMREQLGLGPVHAGFWQQKAYWRAETLCRVMPGPHLFPRIDKAAATF